MCEIPELVVKAAFMRGVKAAQEEGKVGSGRQRKEIKRLAHRGLFPCSHTVRLYPGTAGSHGELMRNRIVTLATSARKQARGQPLGTSEL